MRDVVQAIDTALILKDIAAENDGEAAHASHHAGTPRCPWQRCDRTVASWQSLHRLT
jgi:hypothetical protein